MCACSGDDCPEGTSPKSLFGLAATDSLCRDSTTFCSKTIGEVCSRCYFQIVCVGGEERG